MSDLYQLVVFKNGDTLRGKIKSKQIKITTDFGTMSCKIKDIAQIHITNPPYAPLDIIRLLNGDKCSGLIEGDMISVATPGGSTADILKTTIHTIMFMGHH